MYRPYTSLGRTVLTPFILGWLCLLSPHFQGPVGAYGTRSRWVSSPLSPCFSPTTGPSPAIGGECSACGQMVTGLGTALQWHLEEPRAEGHPTLQLCVLPRNPPTPSIWADPGPRSPRGALWPSVSGVSPDPWKWAPQDSSNGANFSLKSRSSHCKAVSVCTPQWSEKRDPLPLVGTGEREEPVLREGAPPQRQRGRVGAPGTPPCPTACPACWIPRAPPQTQHSWIKTVSYLLN